MSTSTGYGQFCPVAMASEILCTRWTMLLLRELICGSTRFNDLRKGVPKMSPALLSKRLKDLESKGVVERRRPADGAAYEYYLTEAGRDLQPIVMSIGFWGQRYVESQVSLKNLDPSLLMWDMRRNIDLSLIRPGRSVIEFMYPEIARPKRKWWLLVDCGIVDLCRIDPGFPVDLYVQTSLRTMTAIWMGLLSFRQAVDEGSLMLHGDADLVRSMQRWLRLSPFAREENRGGVFAAAAE